MTDRSPIVELLTRLGRDDDIRLAFGAGNHFHTELVPQAELDARIEAANAEQQNVWYEINPSSFAGESGRSSAKHVTALTTLYVDVDYKDGGMGDYATAIQLIDDLTAALGAPPAAIVHTGNGLQPYWPVTGGGMPDEESRRQVLRTLARFKALVDTLARALNGKIDSLFDLPRIFRAPGSFNWKNPDDPKPVTVDFPEGAAEFTLEELNEIFDAYAIDAEPRDVAAEPVSGMADWEWAEHDCEFVSKFRADVTSGQVTARHPRMLAWVAQLHGMIRYGCLTEATFEELRRLIDVRHQDLCRSQQPVREPEPREFVAALRWGAQQASLWTETQLIDEMHSHVHSDFLAMFTSGVRTEVPVEIPQPAPQPADKPVISLFTKQPLPAPVTHEMPPMLGALALSVQSRDRLTYAAHTDAGNAELFAQSITGRFIHVSGIGWYRWEGVRWVEDLGGLHREALKDLFTQRLAGEQDLDEQKWLTTSLNAARMTATLKWAETIPGIQAYAHEMDRNPLELVTPGGIMHLRDRTLRAADPRVDRNTKITSVGPDWTRAPERFLDILDWAFSGDAEMIAYLQRLFGMALLGSRHIAVFPIFLGSGANGKSLIFEMLLSVIGSYGMKLSDRFLVLHRNEQHPEEVAQLQGVRLALASEVNANTKFNEQLVKSITGDDTLRARKMRENSYEFHNAVTMMGAFNHLPGIVTGGPSWWRRQRIIEMNRVWPEAQRDDTLGSRIAAEEGGAILAWMVDGAGQFLVAGEQPPAQVLAATARYRAEEDALARYIDTRLVADSEYTVTRAGAYMDYQQWANANRIFPVLSEPKFAREFLMIHPQARIETNDEIYVGFRLASAYLPPEVNSNAAYEAVYGT